MDRLHGRALFGFPFEEAGRGAAYKKNLAVKLSTLEVLLVDIEMTGCDQTLLKRMLKYYGNPDLVIIDEFLRWKLTSDQVSRLFKVIDYRRANKKL